jgi:cytochrome c peroxidase
MDGLAGANALEVVMDAGSAAKVRWGTFGGGALALLAGAALLASSVPAGAAPDSGEPAPRTAEEAKVELGRRLFFDPVASLSGARSCASCHDPEHGFSDPTPRSDDDLSRTRRHSQTLIDGHLNPTAHWDGEFDSIEALVVARLGPQASIKGSQGAHGASFRELGLSRVPSLRSVGGPAGTGGYGGSGRPSTPPPTSAPAPTEPRDPNRPTTPKDPAPKDADDDAPASPAADDKAAKDGKNAKDAKGEGRSADQDGANEGRRDGEQDAAKAGSEGGAGGREGASREKAKDEPRSRSDGKAKVPARVLPLDLAKLPDVAETIEESGRYGEAFQAAFGSRAVTTSKLAEAIAAYCRTIRSTEAPVDRHLAGDAEALDPAARRGLALFTGRAGCAQCHSMKGRHPTFTDYAFHNTGVAWRSIQRGVRPGEREVDLEETALSDSGRESVTTQLGDRRAFKTATLRDLPRRGPYMHDGAFDTLSDVVRYYARGASNDKRQDPLLRPFEASDEDVADLVAFLEALNGDERPGQAPRPWHVRAERTRVQLVDSRRRPLAGFPVTLVPEGDELPERARFVKSLEVVSDDRGWIEFMPPRTTHTRLVLPDGLQPVGGGLVPDSCPRAVVEVPIDGRIALVVAFEPGTAAPPSLAAEHEGTMRLPGHPAPRTVLHRVSDRDLDGRRVASYEGWLRTDVPPDVIVRIPGDKRARPEHRLKLKDDRTLKLDLGS